MLVECCDAEIIDLGKNQAKCDNAPDLEDSCSRLHSESAAKPCDRPTVGHIGPA